MRIGWWIFAIGNFTVLSTPAFGCFCSSTPMCSHIETYTQSSAVFVGRVVDVWPSREAIASESRRLQLPALRHLILQRWHGVLSAEEEGYIRTTQNKDAIESRYAIMQRVLFEVSEGFVGPQVREVYTDATSCGYRFELGSVYLVNSSREGARFRTGACSRTSRVESDDAVEDLKALRAWKSGRPLPPRIYGHIGSASLRIDTRVDLKDDRDDRSVLLGVDGRFWIEDLEKKQYRLQVEDARGKGERVIDLSRLSCFEAFPWFGGGWHVAGSPGVIDSPQTFQMSDPPPLLPKPPQK
jgi:hypothetical protein